MAKAVLTTKVDPSYDDLPEDPPAEAAEQASPYPYPSENPPSTVPSRLATLAAPGRWKTPESALQADACPPSRSPCRPAHPATPLPLAPLPRNRHRPRTRSVATPRSHLDCRNVLILIVAGHRPCVPRHPGRITGRATQSAEQDVRWRRSRRFGTLRTRRTKPTNCVPSCSSRARVPTNALTP